MTKLRWGILGAGKFARTFGKGVQASTTGELVAIGSRTQESADAFGEEMNVPKRYASYQALLDDPEIDVVHISLPNHMHAEWTVKCAQAGKHILCEKPFTTNYAEAVATLEEVQKHPVFLMEAFMYRCHPQTWKLKELLDQKVIGDVKLIQVNFTYNMGMSEQSLRNIRMRNDVAGGGIMDVGCYTASMARLLAGEEPIVVQGAAAIGAISRIDEVAAASLLFPSGAVGSIVCGTQVNSENVARVYGTEGSLTVPNPWFPHEGDNKILLNKAGETQEILVNGGLPLYAIEADTVAKYLEARQAPPPCMTWDDTLGNMKTLDAWRASVGLVFDVEK
jgi:predicted dehydrogenase